jgi:hypothetical protein
LLFPGVRGAQGFAGAGVLRFGCVDRERVYQVHRAAAGKYGA